MAEKFSTSYMDEAIFDLRNVIDTAKEALADVEFDTIVGTGFSGGIVIPALALEMGKKFVLIRKETDDSHHGGGNLVGELGSKWVFVDDFICSGKTRRRVLKKIQDASEDRVFSPECVGQYMYCNWRTNGPRFEPFNADWTESLW